MMGYETTINVNGYGYGHGNGFVNGSGYGYGNGLIVNNGTNYEERESGSEGGENDNSPVMSGGGGGGGSSKMFSLPSSSSSSSSSSSPRRYIEHHVTKMDTLAGVAIRYGVEVADIKKMNGLVTDLQMFALKKLQIPLPGRHPPSPCLPNSDSAAGSEQTPPRPTHSDLLDTFQSLRLTPDRKFSPAMCSLRDYYGLNVRRNSSEGCEMAVYSKGSNSYLENEALFMNPPLNHHRRSKSVANGLKSKEDEVATDVDTHYRKWIDKLTLRPQKMVSDFSSAPEKLLREESGSGGWFSAITGKGLALRTKAGSRTNLAAEAEAGNANGFPFSLGDSVVGESSSGVRKSSSTPSLQEQDANGGSSIWSASKWSLKPDLQAALSKPIFDGLPKPITGRKPKTALD